MGDEQAEATNVVEAVEAEVSRIVRVAGQIGTYRGDILQTYGLRILTETVPGFTRDRWDEIMTGETAVQRAERRRAERVAADQATTDRDFLRQHGRPVCCPDCDRQNADTLRRAIADGRVAVPAEVPEDEDEEPEEGCDHTGTVRCIECDGTGCGGVDRWGQGNQCDTGCPTCDRCEEESHPCQHCGLDPACDHRWQCTDCEHEVAPTRDGWGVQD